MKTTVLNYALTQRLKYFSSHFVNLPLLQMALGFIVGIVGIFYLDQSWLCCGAGLLLLFGVLVSTKPRSFLGIVILIVFVGLGVLRFKQVAGEDQMAQVASRYGESVNSLTVISMPEETKSGLRVYAKTEDAVGKILLNYPIGYDLSAGDILQGEFLLEEPESIEDFDYKFYLQTQGVQYVSRVNSLNIAGKENSLLYTIANFKKKLSKRIRYVLPEPHASLAAGLVWGERANMPEIFKNNLSSTGTTHIIAVSGFNVSLLVTYFMGLAGVLPRRSVSYLVGVFLFLFLILVGIDNLPAMRAGIMGFTVLIAKNFGRKTSIISLISASVLVLSLINPLSIFTVSFQLSFAALVGLIGIDGIITKIFGMLAKRAQDGIIRSLLNLLFEKSKLTATMSAIIATTPISVLNFETFSVVAVFVNFLVLPFVSFLTIFSIGLSAISLVSLDLARIFAVPMIIIMDIVIWIINSFAKLPFSSMNVSGLNNLIVLTAYVLIALIIFETAYRNANAKILASRTLKFAGG